MESIKLQEYFQKLKERSKSKARSRLHEIVEPYLSSYQWDDDKLSQQFTAFFVITSQFLKSHTDYELKKYLEWGRTKHVHVLQLVRLLWKKQNALLKSGDNPIV